MKYQTGVADLRPLIAIHADGKRYAAYLQDLSNSAARVQLLEQQPIRQGELVALSIADLPTFLGDVTGADSDILVIKFRSTLHPTVLDYIGQEVGHAAQNSAVESIGPDTKRATRRPPFPFEK